jgi:hypothetical protein
MSFLANLSNREKKLWATLTIDLGAAWLYFSGVYSTSGGFSAPSVEMAAVVIEVMVFSIIAAIIVFGWINYQAGEERADERDYMFSARANSVAYAVLCVCVALTIGSVFRLPDNFFKADSSASIPAALMLEITPMLMAHMLLTALIVSAAAKALVQLYFYRRG